MGVNCCNTQADADQDTAELEAKTKRYGGTTQPRTLSAGGCHVEVSAFSFTDRSSILAGDKDI
jgi:hypothetical protein